MLKNDFKGIKLNKEICELIGAFIGDGYLSSKYLMGISGDKNLDEDYLKNYLQSLIKRNFPFTKPKIYYKKKENTIMLRVYSKQLFNFFLNTGFKQGKKAHTVTIPKKIVENEEFLKATIRGIFDTDGCIFLDKRKAYIKPYPRITLQLASIGLINQIENYLKKDFTLYVSKNNRDGYRNYVEIYGHKQLEKFLKQIGFSNKRHKDKIRTPL